VLGERAVKIVFSFSIDQAESSRNKILTAKAASHALSISS
jgi:hypothetical protein